VRSEPLFDASKDHGTYSAVDWRNIEKSIAGVALDAPLRETLQDVANRYAAMALLEPVPRGERIAQRRQKQAVFEAAREQLGPTYAAASELQDAIALEQREIDKLAAMPRTKTAERLHRKFWRELLELWRSLPIAPEQCTHAGLRAFLRACSTPIFLEHTTPKALTLSPTPTTSRVNLVNEPPLAGSLA
jgi:hypothetical protein